MSLVTKMSTIDATEYLESGRWPNAHTHTPSQAKGIVKSILLVSTVPFAIISMIPGLRLVGTLGNRSIALLHSALNFTGALSEKNKWVHFTKGLKIGALICGIVGVASSLPALIIVSLISDIATESFECAKAIYQKKYNAAFIHASQLIADVFILTTILTGTHTFMYVAIAAHGLCMLYLAGKFYFVDRLSIKGAISHLCYVALFCTTINNFGFKTDGGTPNDMPIGGTNIGVIDLNE